MEPFPADWQAIGETPPAAKSAGKPAPAEHSRWSGRVPMTAAAALRVGGIVAVLGVVLVAWTAAPSELVINGGDPVSGLLVSDPGTGSAAVATDGAAATFAGLGGSPGPRGDLVIDVEGAVAQPGLHHLTSGARVGDAVAAAGGFSSRVDAAAAAGMLNLAAPLKDGDKIRVPALGDAVAPVTGSSGSPGAGSNSPTSGAALIDLNTADETTLETLPGIGPVTGAAIIAARSTTPFASVDDLRTRGIVGASTFDKLKALVTVGG